MVQISKSYLHWMIDYWKGRTRIVNSWGNPLMQRDNSVLQLLSSNNYRRHLCPYRLNPLKYPSVNRLSCSSATHQSPLLSTNCYPLIVLYCSQKQLTVWYNVFCCYLDWANIIVYRLATSVSQLSVNRSLNTFIRMCW